MKNHIKLVKYYIITASNSVSSLTSYVWLCLSSLIRFCFS